MSYTPNVALHRRLVIASLTVAAASLGCSFENDAGKADYWSVGPTAPCTNTTERLQVKADTAMPCVGATFELIAAFTRSCQIEDVSKTTVFATSAPDVVVCEKNVCRALSAGTVKLTPLHKGREGEPLALTVTECDAGVTDAGRD